MRHDGICSGNQEAVLSLKFKGVSPVQEAKGPLLQFQESFLVLPVTEISQLFYLTVVRSRAQQNTTRCTVFTRVLFFWQVASWSRMQSLTGARASLWVAAKAGGMKLFSVQKGTKSVSRGGRAALVKPRVCHCSAGWERFWKGGHGSRAEVSQVDWARFMLVKRSTGHLRFSELIGRLHSSVHWL